MSSDTIYHYVYRITNIVEKKHYYGKRSSRIEPKLDLGKRYFSSSTDKEFILDQNLNPQNYRYKIVQVFKSEKEALTREIKLHFKFDVSINIKFYNKAKQTSTGFGSGHFGRPHTDEWRKNHSKAMAGENHPRYGKKLSEESRAKISNSLTGKVRSVESKTKQSNSSKGKFRSEDTMKKMKKPKSEAHRQNMRKAQRQVKCIHCGVVGGVNLMSRYHHDKCKLNAQDNIENLSFQIFNEDLKIVSEDLSKK